MTSIHNFDDDSTDTIEYSEYDDLYCPDFSVVRRPTSHTTVRAKSYFFGEEPEILVTIKRLSTGDAQMIPITEVDNFLNVGNVKIGEKAITLGRHNVFNDFIDALEKFSTHVVSSYNKQTMRDLRIYTVPVTDYIKTTNANLSQSSGCNIFSTKSTIPVDINDDGPRERFIIINGALYSTLKTYKRNGKNFIPYKIPVPNQPTLSDKEQSFRITKTTTTRDSITMTFHRPTNIHSVFINPENMQFELVHTDMIHCHQRCTKTAKHCINVLKNDPQFLKRFETWYRSPNTDGQWVKIGTFNGSTSMFDTVRVDFDEVIAKEIRIVPVSYHIGCELSTDNSKRKNSYGFDKISIMCVGQTISQTPIVDDLFVTYSVYMPRDGKYIQRFDKVKQGLYFRDSDGCRCCKCTGHGKGYYKDKCRYYNEVYNDLYE